MPRHRITTRRAADLLRGEGADHLRHFVGEARSVAEAAELAHLPLHRMYRWVKRLEQAELLTIEEAVPRAGRPIKLYRAVGQTFEIDPDLLPDSPMTTEFRRDTEAMVRAFERVMGVDQYDAILHVDYATTDVGTSVTSNLTPRRLLGGTRTIPSTWSTRTLWLTDDEAAALVEDLRAALSRAPDPPPHTPGTRPYLVAIAAVPDDDRGIPER